VTSPMRRLDPKVTQSGIEAGSLKCSVRHRAVHAKIGEKPPLNGHPEEVATLWITSGMTRITHYCKSCFLDIGAESRRWLNVHARRRRNGLAKCTLRNFR
jgi:hypothetical protein